jgi:hypothetical protein
VVVSSRTFSQLFFAMFGLCHTTILRVVQSQHSPTTLPSALKSALAVQCHCGRERDDTISRNVQRLHSKQGRRSMLSAAAGFVLLLSPSVALLLANSLPPMLKIKVDCGSSSTCIPWNYLTLWRKIHFAATEHALVSWTPRNRNASTP